MDDVPVIMSFSFALVIATYSILISSATASILSFSEITILGMGLYLILVSISVYSAPIPSSLCKTTDAPESVLLKYPPQPDKNTTGNSSPLLLCMVIILTPSDASPLAVSSSTSFLSIFSIYLIKSKSPLKLILS